MKNITYLLLAFLTLTLTTPSDADENKSTYKGPIASDLLFAPSSLHNLKLSPSGEMIALLDYDGTERSISFIKTKSFVKAIGIKYKTSDSVNNYYWLDNHTLYLKMTISNRIRSFFVSLTESNQSWEEVAPDISYNAHKLDGRIIGILDSESSKLLYLQENEKGYVENLFITTVADLIRGDISGAKAVPHLLEGAFNYRYFAKSRRLVGILVDQDDNTMTYKQRNFDQSNWQLMTHIDFNKIEEDQENNDDKNRKAEDFKFQIQGFLNDNKIAVLTNFDSDKDVIYEYDLLNQEFTKVLYSHPKYDVYSATTDSQQLESVTYIDHGKISFKYFNKATAKEYKKLRHAFKDKQLVIVSKHAPSNTMIVQAVSANSPGKYYYYDGKINEAMLIASKYEKLNGYTFGHTESLDVPVEPGVSIEAYLTQPLTAHTTPYWSCLMVAPSAYANTTYSTQKCNTTSVVVLVY